MRTVDEDLLTGYTPLLGRQPTLDDYLWFGAWRRGQQIIATKPERRLSPRGFHEWWVRVVKAAGVRYRRPHMTRHTLATDLPRRRSRPVHGQEVMGHSSTRTTEGYIHSQRSGTRSAVELLAQYRSKMSEGELE